MQQPFLSTDNKLVRFIVEPGYRWLRHLLLCLLLLTLSYENVIFTYEEDINKLGWSIPLLILIQFVLYLSFYLNIYLLVPRLFLRGKYVAYSLALFTLLTLNFAGSYCIEILVTSIYSLEPSSVSYANPSRSILVDYISLVSVSGMCCLGTTITILFRNWLTDGMRKQEMESEHRRKRILKLKDSVNPAFLSDILLIAANETDTYTVHSEDILIRLSRFLRYRLYDSNRQVVFLNSEAAFLNNYLSLMAEIRQGFSYSITSQVKNGRAVLSPSILASVTDAILDNIKEGASLVLKVDLEMEDKSGIKLNFTAQSPGTPATLKMQEILGSILDISYPSGYDLNVRGGGGKLYVRIGLNKIHLI